MVKLRTLSANSLIVGLALLLALVPSAVWSSAAQSQPLASAAPTSFPDRSQVTETLQSAPLMFIENVGQFDQRARFQARGADRTLWLAEDGVWVTVTRPSGESERPSAMDPPGARPLALEAPAQPREAVHLKLSFVGANSHPRLEPFDRLDTHVSYFMGADPEKWHADVPVWEGVRYVGIYPDLDLEITGGDIWSWRVIARSPEADLGAVQLRVEGGGELGLNAGGSSVRVSTALGKFALPLLDVGGAEEGLSPRVVDGKVIAPFAGLARSRASVPAGALDMPEDLLYATFLGGSSMDIGYGIAVDGSGSAYVTGYTRSSDFPTTPGAFDTSCGTDGNCNPNQYGYSTEDAFVVKVNADGTGLVYATFLGGSDWDYGNGIAVDGSGSAYVTGYTGSSDFPAASGPGYDTSHNGYEDAFVAKLAMGRAPTYSISGYVRDGSGNPIPDVAISAGAAGSATTDADGYYTLSRVGAGTYTLTPSKNCYTFSPPTRVFTVPPDATGVDFMGVLNLSVSHIEVTQATQDESNGVPIIADKPTFVRVYVDGGAGCISLPNVTGVLRGYGPAGELSGSPLSPVNRSITAYHEKWQGQRDDLEKTLNFALPLEWRAGTITLTAEVNGASGSQEVFFQPARTPNVIYAPIRYRGRDPDHSRIRDGSWWALRIYPTSHLQYTPLSTIDWELCLGGDCGSARIRDFHQRLLLLQLALMRRFYNLESEPDADYIFGWLPGGTLGVEGFSAQPWHAAVGEDHPTETQRIFSHETGHLMGHLGINTGDCPSGDPGTGWPHSNARIQDFGLDGYGFGWLISSSSAVKNPADTYDYMSYCGSLTDGTVWTSPWTYEHIYTETLSLQATHLAAQSVSASQPYFIASGLVYTDDTATLDPMWVVTTTTMPDNPPAGSQYCLEAQTAAGTLLLPPYCFDLSFVNYEIGEATGVDGFNLMLPYPSDVGRIALKKGSQELAVRVVSANVPTVTVLSPNGGETWAASGVYTIAWSAGDANDDPLTYSVLYSGDGSSWVPVGVAITQTQLAVNGAELAGGDAARVRVLVSDGVNTSSDESDGAFTVGQKPPAVHILSPEGDVAIRPDSVLWLYGYAYDLEDGTLAGDALQWSSDRDGVLGTGSEAMVALSPGQHVITLTATDSDGSTATASINVYAGCKVFLPLILRSA